MNTVLRALQLAFDVGHSSIGWAVLKAGGGQMPEILGCGAVIFPANDCLASQRRAFRRQRRHVRATRLRIARIERLLAHLGVMSKADLDSKHEAGGGHSAPWLLAARVLRGGKLLGWEELWDVIRWYAHNRGYDGNKAWSTHEMEAEKEDAEKVENARALYTKYGTRTMAETFCAVSGLDPLGTKISCNLPGNERPKALNAAFPREDVEGEVRAILEKHVGILPKLDVAFIDTLMKDWRAIPAGEIRLPGRYRGGLLFGQLVPRFDNRIIATCPMTFERVYQAAREGALEPEQLRTHLEQAIRRLEKKHGVPLAEELMPKAWEYVATLAAKVPVKNCGEFLRFRWAMLVANIQVTTGEERNTRALSKEERNALDARMGEAGFFTQKEFKKVVREITGGAADNLSQMLMHPDADKALVLDPARKALSKTYWDKLFPLLPIAVQRRAVGQLRHGKTIVLRKLIGESTPEIDAAITALLDAENTRKSKKQSATTRDEILAAAARCEALSGRAPYSRAIMREAAEFVFSTGEHPTGEGGPLYRSEAVRNAQLQRAIDEQTNNHLVRHRLLILDRLHRDILKEYAGDDSARIERAAIEVNRDLREFSGKTAKQVAQDIGQRLANFKNVTERLEKAFEGKNIRVTPGLIRKARIAEDLGWTCPYTGKGFDEFDLLHRKVDKDHVIPRSERASDSLESLVITFNEVNRMKGKRTAARFVEECQSQTVPGSPNLQIKPLSNYTRDVSALETFRGHNDDKRRKKRRKELLLLRDYVEKEFVPRDLTQTSQIVRLGAQMLERLYAKQPQRPVITSLPGSVTGAVRKSWSVLGCLATANPMVMNPDDLDDNGKSRPHNKTEIRDITHLHHALDACVIGFTSLFFPRDGGVWELLIKRRLNAEEQKALKARIGSNVEFGQNGESKLIDLPAPLKEQIRKRLAERRVMQHIPAEMTGLRVEQNAWRVVFVKDGEAQLRQRIRQPDGTRITKLASEKVGKLLGLQPNGGLGKLQQNKAALVIPDNYGLALDPTPVIIPFHKVPVRLRELREANGGKVPRVLRNGMLIQIPKGKFSGVWKIFSIKNNASGMAMDIGRADVVRLRNKTEGHKINVRLATLLQDGLTILPASLSGMASNA
jgi:hypothetical protein